MHGRLALLRLLADGRFHRGASLARSSGLPRASLERELDRLSGWGLEVIATPGHGYRLSDPIDLLDAARIRAGLAPSTAARVRRLAVEPEIDSTNTALLAVSDLPHGQNDVLLAEFQSAGRGRRGRAWRAPFASGLCLSLSLNLTRPHADLGTLSLAVGVAVLRALKRRGVPGLTLKWPNDVLAGDAKLAGILCELRGESSGATYVVVGVGINMRLPASTEAALAAEGTRSTDLKRIAPDICSRSELAAELVNELVTLAMEFDQRGFAAYHAEWTAADALNGRAVSVHDHGGVRGGIARGIAADGTLCVELASGLTRLTAGDVTLRPLT
jgi:BirA family transcriptional regulator, biotin operon repressor / biotin---[acetyl-CoA-carboxylase] ligase